MRGIQPDQPYDVIIVGGAISGSATALVAKRLDPSLRILIIERTIAFKRRVGESTVEISSYFLGEVLGINQYLSKEHIIKQGLRFYFHNKNGTCPDTCSEIGPHYNVRLTSYQVDRAKLDEHLLECCQNEGIEVLRPAEVKDFELKSGHMQRISVKCESKVHEFETRWLVDASGVRQLLARKSGWMRKNEAHPISSAWARWSGVGNWDSPLLKKRFPDYGSRCFAKRNPATNHLIGKGWWSWWIPLKQGDVSIGVVWDERITAPPDGDNPQQRLRSLLEEHPMAKYLLENAVCNSGDMNWRKHLPYWSTQMAGDGFALVGDAAGFIDPFYSPGLDWVSYTSFGTAQMIVKERSGDWDSREADVRNDLLIGSYHRWFNSIYKDKYFYMGDWELMKVAFQLDLGLYYLGVVSQPYKYGEMSFVSAPLNGPCTRFPAWLIATYNKRLSRIGKSRIKRKTWGNKNNHHYLPFKSFGFDFNLKLRVLAALTAWLSLEIKEGWRTWLTRD